MHRWELYTLLQGKGNFKGIPETEIIKEVEKMSVHELKEGVIEYLLALKRGGIPNDG